MNVDISKFNNAMANAILDIGELASKSGVSRNAISKIKNGKLHPRPVTLGKLAKALGVKVEDLLAD